MSWPTRVWLENAPHRIPLHEWIWSEDQTGYVGGISDVEPIGVAFNASTSGVLLPEFTGYGGSLGNPSEGSLSTYPTLRSRSSI